jgi:hypothetical protein
MAPRLKPGLAFWIVCDQGFAVGLMTHHVERIGHLVWMAAPFYEQPPSIEAVRAVETWRWPVFFPLGAALHRKIVERLGQVDIPPRLHPMPTFRGSNGVGGWNRVIVDDGGIGSKPVGPTEDRSLPIYSVVNDTRLKEMLVSGWMPRDRW